MLSVSMLNVVMLNVNILIVMAQTPVINRINETKKEKFLGVKRSSLSWLITFPKSIYLKET
jgi:hypothetical protein